jgi:hypothetical protein
MRAEARARNVLAAASVSTAENSSVFLGHLPGERGVREIGPGTLLLIHEASMMSMPDLADIIARPCRRESDHRREAGTARRRALLSLGHRFGVAEGGREWVRRAWRNVWRNAPSRLILF